MGNWENERNTPNGVARQRGFYFVFCDVRSLEAVRFFRSACPPKSCVHKRFYFFYVLKNDFTSGNSFFPIRLIVLRFFVYKSPIRPTALLFFCRRRRHFLRRKIVTKFEFTPQLAIVTFWPLCSENCRFKS